MRSLKVFAITFFICSLLLFGVSAYLERSSATPWITAQSEEVTVSVKDDRSSWQAGITAGVGEDETLTDRVRLTHVGQLSADGSLKATFTVTDDLGRSVSLVRTVILRDYEPPTFELIAAPVIAKGGTVTLSNLIAVSDSLDGDITHLVQIVSSDLDTAKAGSYDMLLAVKNSYGVRVDYTLTITVI